RKKVKIFLAKPTAMFGDSNLNRLRAVRLINALKRLKHMESNSTFVMNRCCDLLPSFCRHVIFDLGPAPEEFIPLDTTESLRIGKGIDNFHEIIWHRIHFRFRRLDLSTRY